MAELTLQNVSDTAFMVAAYRARESQKRDALFHDPLAARLAGEHGARIVASLPAEARMTAWSVIVRTHVIDRMVSELVADGVQLVLNLGAGLDTRPYRMELPADLHWIEVDHPELIALKASRLTAERPRCQLERIELDLADAGARRALFADLAARFTKVLVLTEGVLLYLSAEDVGALADDLRRHASFTHWIADYFSPETYRHRRKGLESVMKKAPFLFEPADYFGFFLSHGWRPERTRYLGEAGDALGRPAPFPLVAKLLFRVLARVMPPARRVLPSRFMAYVVFEPAAQPLTHG